MSKLAWILMAVIALTVVGANDAWAQGRGGGNDRVGPLVIVLDDDLLGSQGRRGRGPAFCRSGAGHPVHGRRWCAQKRFGLGRDIVFDTRRRGRTRQGAIVIGRDGEIVIRTGRR
ncbi:MAG: hypothetical protein P8Y29_00585 [Gemmatimonadota bacterium]